MPEEGQRLFDFKKLPCGCAIGYESVPEGYRGPLVLAPMLCAGHQAMAPLMEAFERLSPEQFAEFSKIITDAFKIKGIVWPC